MDKDDLNVGLLASTERKEKSINEDDMSNFRRLRVKRVEAPYVCRFEGCDVAYYSLGKLMYHQLNIHSKELHLLTLEVC